jgi:hypothetical protein
MLHHVGNALVYFDIEPFRAEISQASGEFVKAAKVSSETRSHVPGNIDGLESRSRALCGLGRFRPSGPYGIGRATKDLDLFLAPAELPEDTMKLPISLLTTSIALIAASLGQSSSQSSPDKPPHSMQQQDSQPASLASSLNERIDEAHRLHPVGKRKSTYWKANVTRKSGFQDRWSLPPHRSRRNSPWQFLE